MDEELIRTLLVPPEEAGRRLDAFCASRLAGLSRNRFQKLNRAGRVRVDGRIRSDHYRLKGGERVEIAFEPPAPELPLPAPTELPFSVVYQDEQLVVVNKPAGMVVHPAHGHREDTLVNALLAAGIELPPYPSPLRPGIVHRLDKDTSGLLVVAKTERAYLELARQVSQREVERIYHGIVWGNLGRRHLQVAEPIGRHPVHRKKMAVVAAGREAKTELFVMDSFVHFDYIRAVIHTGRTHQIRVHLSHLSHPILGDPTYGGRRKRGVGSDPRTRRTVEKLLKIMGRQALHASVLAFRHPLTSSRMRFVAALPDDMIAALEVLYREDRYEGGRL